MRRKITDLEQELITHGYRLTHKVYDGKHSEKILSYVYCKDDQSVALDYKREKVIDFGLWNVNFNYLSKQDLITINQRFKRLNDFVAFLTEPSIIDTLMETAETLNDIVEGFATYKKNEPMTFEEMDELCKEKEDAISD